MRQGMRQVYYIYILDPTRALRARLNLSPSDSFFWLRLRERLPWLLPLRLLLLLRCSSCSSCSCSCPLCCSTCSSWSCSCPSTQHIRDKRTSGCSGDLKDLPWSRSDRLGHSGYVFRRSLRKPRMLTKFRPSRAGAFFLLPEASEGSFWEAFLVPSCF